MVLNKKLLANVVTESKQVKYNFVNDMLKLGNWFFGIPLFSIIFSQTSPREDLRLVRVACSSPDEQSSPGHITGSTDNCEINILNLLKYV
jgi:hypothetical protein